MQVLLIKCKVCAPPKKHRFLALCRSGAFTFMLTLCQEGLQGCICTNHKISGAISFGLSWSGQLLGFFCIMVFLLFLSESHWECCTSFSIAPTSTSESSFLGRPSCTWYLLTFLHLSHWFSFCSQFCYTILLYALSKPLSVGK